MTRAVTRVWVALVLALAMLAPVAASKSPEPQAPALADLLARAAAYHDAYGPKVSGVSLEEQFMLVEVSGNQMRPPQRLASDFLIVTISRQIEGLRDPFAVDSKPLRPREARLVPALTAATAASWQQVQTYVREHAEYLRSNVVVWYNDPMLALQFIAAANQSRLTYKLEGSKKINGVQTSGVGFKEVAKPGTTSLLDVPGNPLGSGRFWIDTATGAIHQTELWVQSDTDTARVQVVYAPDTSLGLLLPREASHTFEMRERSPGVNAMGNSAAQQKLVFECNATYEKASRAVLDLSRLAR